MRSFNSRPFCIGVLHFLIGVFAAFRVAFSDQFTNLRGFHKHRANSGIENLLLYIF